MIYSGILSCCFKRICSRQK